MGYAFRLTSNNTKCEKKKFNEQYKENNSIEMFYIRLEVDNTFVDQIKTETK